MMTTTHSNSSNSSHSSNLLIERTAMPFIGTKESNVPMKGSTCLIGFPFDGTTSFRPGARLGSKAIRDASIGIETYSPTLDLDIEDYNNILDLGDIAFYPSRRDLMEKNFFEVFEGINLLTDQVKIVTLGGEHSISFSPISLYLKNHNYPDLLIIHLDAHTDLRDGYLHDHYSHAAIIRRVLDIIPEGANIIQQGIRSGTRDEFKFIKENKTNNKMLMNSLDELIQHLQKNVSDSRPIYLTLDLDYFDPAYLPGTGTPEAGGESFKSLLEILKVLRGKNFVGADIVELSPMIDPTQNSSSFASLVTREVILALAKRWPNKILF
ncbi:MAG: agmatinase [Oligoflexia bacterium]|nr:agmatinase [Oligoflexia bacterium]